MRWFILRVQSRKVVAIAAAIGPDNCWLPLERRVTKPSGKHTSVVSERPMIPGWLFVKEHLYHLWPQEEGVYGAVKFGRMGPLWIEDADLAGLRQAEQVLNAANSQLEASFTPSAPRLAVGSMVSIQGLLAGVCGRLEAYTSPTHARVSISNMSVVVHHCLLREAGV